MNTEKTPILIVDDDPDIREILKDRLEPFGHPVLTAENGKQALNLVNKEDPVIMFLDLQMRVMDGMEVLRALKDFDNVEIIMITAHGTVDSAVKAMKEGAYDFITKPFSMDHIDVVIKRALENDKLRRENLCLKSRINSSIPEIVGKSAKLQDAIEVAKRVAVTPSTVLLLGESGSGKEVFANWIHNWSPRKDAPFIAINCVALRDELLESELFGHEKGAFTGAHDVRKGKLEIADGGTVFLDEIGDFKPELQAKLLRVLQEREFERVGGNRRIKVDIRVIAATNRDLQKEVKDGNFREDLFFRLNVVTISLPPLRHKKEDIPLLADYFLRRTCCNLNKPVIMISGPAMEHMKRYNWPGNVRELSNMIERAVILAKGTSITPEDLPLLHMRDMDHEGMHGKTYHDAVRSYQKEIIKNALNESGGNQSRAAELLGLQRTYLSRLIKNLEVNESREQT
jgi:DNA-binding NtrC family response regulator